MANIFKTVFRTINLVLGFIILLTQSVVHAEDKLVNIYSARKEALILPLLERFEADTGIAFQLVTGKADGLLKRIEIEGEATPADVFITVDVGRLYKAKSAGILGQVDSPVLVETIPAHLRDKDNQWFGLSQRARVIFYAKDRVDPSELSTYEALTDEKWRGRFCIRSSSNVYNQSLVASMIEHLGLEKTEKWAAGLVANFARSPGGGDTDQLRAVAAGQCDLTIVNTYYYGRLLNSDKPKDIEVADKIGVFWPNQDGRGAHVNISGAGVTKYAKHPDTAQALLEYLVRPESQSWYGERNNEYPVSSGAEIPPTLVFLGAFTADTIELTLLGENNKAALQLMDRAGWR
ncbi:MAG: extracellular solute-binding protein [Gammaproteobacteria bacterium]|nr:extracellular solute-binding protein [Gammaproteobacteria bacterium]